MPHCECGKSAFGLCQCYVRLTVGREHELGLRQPERGLDMQLGRSAKGQWERQWERTAKRQ